MKPPAKIPLFRQKKHEQKLRFFPKHSNKQALIRNYEWDLENLHTFEGKGGISHRVPWVRASSNSLNFFSSMNRLLYHWYGLRKPCPALRKS